MPLTKLISQASRVKTCLPQHGDGEPVLTVEMFLRVVELKDLYRCRVVLVRPCLDDGISWAGSVWKRCAFGLIWDLTIDQGLLYAGKS